MKQYLLLKAKIFSISRLLKKKLKEERNNEIMKKLKALPLDKLEEVEEIIIDRIFTLSSWEEVQEIINK